MRLGRKIAELRKQNNLSQQDLANKLNVSNKTISKWECGNSVPDIEILNSLTKIFNVSIDKLVNEQESTDSIVNIQETSRTKNKLNNKKVMLISGIALLCVLVVLIPVLCYCLIPRAPKIESSGIFEINQEKSTISCSVSNTTENFSFNDTFKISDNNTWGLYYDITGTLEIKSKTVLLNIGDNTFYVLIENNSGKKRVYSATVRRRPMFTVQFNTLGGTVVASQTIEENGFAIRPSIIPTKSGYTFVDWEFDFTNPITHTTTITANYSANTYTINYHYKDDTIQQSATFGKTIAIKNEETFNKDYYYISSWNTNINGSGKQYNCGISYNYTIANDLDLYVVWKPINYEIIYQLNDGTNGNNPTSYNIESKSIILEDAYKDGYNFEGWFTDSDFENEITSITTGSHDNLILYAKYSVVDYSIEYRLDGGINGNNPTSYNVECDTIILENSTRAGYDFAGWYSDYNYKDKDRVQYINKGFYGNLTLYAKWEKIYNVSDTGIITGVTSYGKRLKVLDIPDKIDGVTINGIGEHAISWCYNLVSLTIPNSIKSISNYAFYACENLTTINYYATNCNNLTNGNNVFTDAGRETSGITVNIGENVQVIPDYLFCSVRIQFETAEISATIKEVNFIGDSKCTRIGDYAFYSCLGMVSIDIPASVVTIGTEALASKNITEINVSENNEFYSSINGILFNKDQTTLIQCPVGKTLCVIPSSVAYISSKAFSECTNLTNITFESNDNLKRIGDFAFNKCEKLENIEIPSSVNFIGKSAFSRCNSLVSITIPENVWKIGSYAFSNCSALLQVKFNAFTCYDFSHQEDSYLFAWSGTTTDGLTVIIGANVTRIPSYMFYASDYSRINRVVFESNSTCESIGYRAFDSCPLTEIELPNSILSIGESAFNNCTQLESVILSNNLTTIADFAFSNCVKLESIIIPISVTNMGSYVFSSDNAKIFCEQSSLPEPEDWSNGWLFNSSGYEIKSTAYWYRENTPLEEGNFWHYNNDGEIEIW